MTTFGKRFFQRKGFSDYFLSVKPCSSCNALLLYWDKRPFCYCWKPIKLTLGSWLIFSKIWFGEIELITSIYIFQVLVKLLKKLLLELQNKGVFWFINQIYLVLNGQYLILVSSPGIAGLPFQLFPSRLSFVQY